MADERVVLPGSARAPVAGLHVIGPVEPTETIEVTIVLRRRAEPDEAAFGGVVPRADLADQYGADPADIARVREVATAAGAQITLVDAASRRVRISGPAPTLAALFGTSLERATVGVDGPVIRHRSGELSVPSTIEGSVLAVLGLDNRPQAYSHMRQAAQPAVSYTPPQLGTIYEFPANTDGSGEVIAIIELGGGYSQADLDAYFAGLGIPVPAVQSVSVDGASNQPGSDPSGADGEVLLDIEVAGALAPAAQIIVYFAPNTDAGFLDAISTAAHASPAPTAISISWGASEDTWTAQARSAMDSALADAALLGVAVTSAAGDSGGSDGTNDGAPHVDFPASSPHVLGCGGTTLEADPATGQVHSEVVWNNGAGRGATGGGVSDVFPVPSWQANAGVPTRSGSTTRGRGVPDVAANADPDTGYQVLVDGQSTVIGGTSAVAPLWAALICRLAQASGKRLGLPHQVFYGAAQPGAVAPGFRDITSGDNGAYQAGPGWDACTGLGVPIGTALVGVITGATG